MAYCGLRASYVHTINGYDPYRYHVLAYSLSVRYATRACSATPEAHVYTVREDDLTGYSCNGETLPLTLKGLESLTLKGLDSSTGSLAGSTIYMMIHDDKSNVCTHRIRLSSDCETLEFKTG